MKNFLNCPNCGAPIESEICPYCGTVFIDFASMDTDKPFYLAIKHNGTVIKCKAMIEHAQLSTTFDNEACCLYADDRVYDTFSYPPKNYLDIHMVLVEDDGIIMKQYELDGLRYGQND